MSISDMRMPEYNDTLTSAQKIGVRFFDQLPEPITREQAETVLVSPLSCIGILRFILQPVRTSFETTYPQNLKFSWEAASEFLHYCSAMCSHPFLAVEELQLREMSM